MKKYIKDWKALFKIIAYGLPILLIITVYLANRSLFLDGINLARNVAESSFSGLSQPLNYEQSAPLLFLYISKLSTLAFGVTEYSLRLTPLISGIACLYFFGRILKRIIAPNYALIGIFWLGTHSMFVRYASEFKQYMTDAFVGMFLIWLVSNMKSFNKRNTMILAIAGAISIWLSMPSVFIIFGIVCYGLITQYKSQNSLLPVISLAIWYLLNFILEYFLILQPAIDSNHMQNFHQNYFIQGKFWELTSLLHDMGLIVSTFRMIVGKSGLAIFAAMTLVFISIYQFIKKKESFGLLLILPILAVFGASFLGKYSLIERLLLFILPILFVLIFYGLHTSIQFLKHKNNWVKYSTYVCLTLAFLVGYAQTNGLSYFIQPFEIDDNRTALEYINNHEMKNHTIVCTQFAYPPYSYYTQHDKNYRHLKLGNAVAANYGESVVQLATDRSIKDKKEVWVLMGHMLEKEISDLISKLEQSGTIKNSYRTDRSAAILFFTQ